mmetsp:Transcript_9280/g.23922  ORF Transcript_9280/g.23922 Transcript_9280/m.23922 type:complete len:342 (-) Transcript_9280:75-1100(-)
MTLRATALVLIAIAARCGADLIAPTRHHKPTRHHDQISVKQAEAMMEKVCPLCDGTCRSAAERCPDGFQEFDYDLGVNEPSERRLRSESASAGTPEQLLEPSQAPPPLPSVDIGIPGELPKLRPPMPLPSIDIGAPGELTELPPIMLLPAEPTDHLDLLDEPPFFPPQVLPSEMAGNPRCCVPADRCMDAIRCRPLTCTARGGVCRSPVSNPFGEEDSPPCHAGEVTFMYTRRCDSGCGYYQGVCGQTCCVSAEGWDTIQQKLRTYEAQEAQGEGASGGKARKLAALGVDEGSAGGILDTFTLDRSEVACLAGVGLLVLLLYARTGPAQKDAQAAAPAAAE